MIKAIRKVASILITLAIIMSVCTIGLGAQAKTVFGGETYNNQADSILYNFNNGTGVTQFRGSEGASGYIEGENGNKYLSVVNGKGNNWHAVRLGKTSDETITSQNNTSTSYKMSEDTSYRVTLKIAFPTGSLVSASEFILQSLLANSNGTAVAESGAVSLNYTDFGFAYSAETEKYELGDTVWVEKSFVFTNNNANTTDGCFYVRISSTLREVYIDDIKIDADPCTVTLQSNVDGIESVTIPTYKTAQLTVNDLEIPDRNEPYIAFAGWFCDKDLINKVEYPYIPGGDATLYARWANDYDVTLNLDDGAGIPLTFRQPGNSGKYIDDPSGRSGKSLQINVGESVELQYGNSTLATVASTVNNDNDGYVLEKGYRYTVSYQVMLPEGSCLGTSYNNIKFGFATVRQVKYAKNTFGKNISPNGGTVDRFYKLDLTKYVAKGDIVLNEEDGKYYVVKGTDWFTVSVMFEANDTYVINDATNGDSKYLVMHAGANKGTTLVFDNFIIDRMDENTYKEYIYNFYNDTNRSEIDEPQCLGDNGKYVSNGGVYIKDARGRSITQCTNSGGNLLRVPLADPDINGGNVLKIESGKRYVVSVKFKSDSVGTTDYSVGIGLTNNANINTVNTSATIDEYDIYSYKTVTPDMETGGYYYITKIIDGSGKSPAGSNKLAYVDENIEAQQHKFIYDEKNYKYNMGRSVVVAVCNMSAEKYAFIESVSVKVFDNYNISDTKNIAVCVDSATGEPTVNLVNDGYKVSDATDTYVNEWGEFGKYISGGAIDQKGNVIGKIYADTVYKDMGDIVVNYPTYDMNSDNDIIKFSGSQGTVKNVDSGYAEHGRVAQLTTKSTMAYVSVGELNLTKADIGKKFYLSFDMKVVSTTKNNAIDIEVISAGEYANILNSGNKRTLQNSDLNGGSRLSKKLPLDGTWTSLGIAFTLTEYDFLNDKSNDGIYIVFGPKDCAGGDVFWYDNISVIEITPGVDEYTTGNTVGNAGNFIRYEAYINGDYQSAGLSFKGSINKSVADCADDIGFTVIPAALATKDWYKAEYWSDSGAVHASCKDNVYASTDTDVTYRSFFIDLTAENSSNNLNALATMMIAKMYVKNADGNYTYYDVNVTSYNEVKAAYRAYSTVKPEEWADYRGISGVNSDGNAFSNITVNGTSIHLFKIVRDFTNRSWLIQNEVNHIQNYIRDNTGYWPTLRDDTKATENTYEISIGNTNRLSVTSMVQYEYDDYEIKICGTKVYITGGSTYAVQVAVTEFGKMLEQKGNLTDADSKTGTYSQTVEKYDSANYYRLVWGDDFDGDTLDENKWIIRDFEKEGADGTTVNMEKNSDTCYLKDGNLIMRGFKDKDGAYSYTACDAIKSDQSMRFNQGYLEMRAKVPDAKGVYSSFWTVGNGGQRGSLEIDIFESLGMAHRQQANIHKWKSADDGGHSSLDGVITDRYYQLMEGSLSDEYHTIGLLWNETEVTFFYDGMKYYSQPTDEFFVQKYLYIVAGFNVGWSGRTQPDETIEWPLEYCIDYIHLHQIDGQNFVLN